MAVGAVMGLIGGGGFGSLIRDGKEGALGLG